MKRLYIITLLVLGGFTAFSQKVDENGRTEAQRTVVATVSSTPEVYLQENVAAKTLAAFTMEYSLPAGKTAGEIIIFHPQVDQELKKISLSQRQGSVQILTKDLPQMGVVLGLYVDGALVETKRVKLQ